MTDGGTSDVEPPEPPPSEPGPVAAPSSSRRRRPTGVGVRAASTGAGYPAAMNAVIARRQARVRLERAARRSASAGLREWLDGDLPTTLGTLSETFGNKLFAAACMALMAPSAIPLPTAGATHVFSLIALLFSVQMIFGRRSIWLPDRFRRRELGRASRKALGILVRFVERCERISRPRLPTLMRSRIGESVLGAITTLFVLGALISPPFSGLDTLPSLAVVLIGVGILLEDAAFAIVGVLVGIGGIGLAIGLGVQVTRLIQALF